MPLMAALIKICPPIITEEVFNTRMHTEQGQFEKVIRTVDEVHVIWFLECFYNLYSNIDTRRFIVPTDEGELTPSDGCGVYFVPTAGQGWSRRGKDRWNELMRTVKERRTEGGDFYTRFQQVFLELRKAKKKCLPSFWQTGNNDPNSGQEGSEESDDIQAVDDDGLDDM